MQTETRCNYFRVKLLCSRQIILNQDWRTQVSFDKTLTLTSTSNFFHSKHSVYTSRSIYPLQVFQDSFIRQAHISLAHDVGYDAELRAHDVTGSLCKWRHASAQSTKEKPWQRTVFPGNISSSCTRTEVIIKAKVALHIRMWN